MTLEDRVTRLEAIAETQTDILDTLVKAINCDDDRIVHLTKAVEAQMKINEALYGLINK